MNIMTFPKASLSRSALAMGLAIVILASTQSDASAQTTGFLQTGGGPYDYSSAANWVNSTINGVWDSSLSLTSTQIITFSGDTALTTGLAFNYTGGFNVTLRGTANSSLTLGGDILVNTVSGNRTITIGSTSSGQNLNVDLGGATRTVSVGGVVGSNSTRALTFVNNVSNGGLILTGGGIVNMNGANTLTSLALRGAYFAHSSAAGDTSISGALTIDGSAGGVNFITLTSGSTTHASITADSLERTSGGIVFFRGATLGTAAPGTNNVNNITFAQSLVPSLVGGGGAAGSQNISILPWATGDTSASGSGSSTTTFVTYDATNGIRLLTSSEFDNSIVDNTVSSNNVQLLAGTTTTIDGNATINSLITASSASGLGITLNGSGVLTITSGAVFLGTGDGKPTISTTLNFGSAQGVIGTGTGKGGTVSSAIQGTGGLVLYQTAAAPALTSAGAGLVFNGNAANSTYTGDTYVLGRATVGVNNFLPNGSRTGNVYVNGILEVNSAVSINGLNGSGSVVRGASGTADFSVGDNNASGTFSGVIANNSGTLNFVKIGTGTQTLSGASTYAGTTTVSAGTLIINGSISSTNAVTVASGAHLGGSGTINGAVNVSGTLAPGNSPGNLTVNNSVAILDGGAMSMEIAGATAGTQYDRVTMTGSSSEFSLTGTNSLALTLSYTPAVDAMFFLVDNQGSSAISGIFELLNGVAADLSQGALFTVSGQQFRISYTGDVTTNSFTGGNDLVVQAVPEPSTWLLLTASLASVIAFRRNRKC